jgi:hypothetical protein
MVSFGGYFVSDYEQRIRAQIQDFDTPKDFDTLGDEELDQYADTMEVVGYKINTYGPDRCAVYRGFLENARAEQRKRSWQN